MRVTTTEKNERFAPCNINEVIIITCFWVAQTKNRKKIWYKYGPRCQWVFRRISNCCKYLSLQNILCMQWYVLVWYYVGKVMQFVHLWFTIAYIYHNFFCLSSNWSANEYRQFWLLYLHDDHNCICRIWKSVDCYW